MNTTVLDAVEKVSELLSIDVNASVIVLDDGDVRRTFMNATRPTAAWESECAGQAPAATTAALVVPMVIDDQEVMHVLSVDAAIGIDVLRCVVTRNSDGEAMFGTLEKFVGHVQLEDHHPGKALAVAMSAKEEL